MSKPNRQMPNLAPLSLGLTLLCSISGPARCAGTPTVTASFGPITVPGTAVIWDANGFLSASSLAGLQGGDGNNNPTPAVQALTFSAAPGQIFTFSASGTVTYNFNESSANVGPDGQAGSFEITSLGSISGFSSPRKFPLVGVFTNGSPSGPAPPPYNYAGGEGETAYAPLLNQVFFIGDGLTGTGSGSPQAFFVPATATQLWLGFPDGHLSGGPPFAYGDNAGKLSVSGTLSLAPLTPPTLSDVISAGAFGGFSSVAPGSWIELYGSNLAINTRTWAVADFTGRMAPTSLDQTSVTIGGQPAFVDFISPGQVNALMPSNTPTGSQQITVTNPFGVTTAFNITVNPTEPGLLAPASFKLNGVQYAAALLPDGTYVLPTDAISGLNSRPARPGDVILLYGVGFGPVTPETPAGEIVEGNSALTSSFEASIGGMSATVVYSGLAPSFTGLYQFDIIVPNIASGNAVPLTFTFNGSAGAQTLYITVAN